MADDATRTSIKSEGSRRGLRRTNSITDVAKLATNKAKDVAKGIIKKGKKKAKKVASTNAIKKEEASHSSPKSVADEDNMSMNEVTVYNVEVEESAAGMEAPVATEDKKSVVNAVNLVLLILDGRRFELLQLEMGSDSKPCVKDILSQIPLQATDQSLRQKTYVEVCDKHGVILDRNKPLTDYFLSSTEESKVFYSVLAIVEDMSVEDVVKYSKPIFSNAKISSFFQGFYSEGDILPQPEPPKKEQSPPVEKVPDKVPEKLPEKVKEPQAEPKKESKNVVAKGSFSKPTAQPTTKPTTQPVKEQPKPKGSSFFTLTLLYLFINLIALGVVRHIHLSSPLQPNESLSIGEYRTSCGLINFIPDFIPDEVHNLIPDVVPQVLAKVKELADCQHESILELSDSGVLSLTDLQTNDVLWEMTTKSTGTAILTENGEVQIGNHIVTSVQSTKKKKGLTSDMLTWPFATNVKVLSNIVKKKNL
jgi:hypothetical protein